MGTLVRDTRIIIPALRDGAPTAGALDALVMSNAGGYFTESLDVGTFTEGIIFLLTASSGGSSPTLDVNMQYSADQKNWLDSGDAVAQQTGNGLLHKKMTANFGKYIRFRLLIGGTNTPTFTVTLKLAMKG